MATTIQRTSSASATPSTHETAPPTSHGEAASRASSSKPSGSAVASHDKNEVEDLGGDHPAAHGLAAWAPGHHQHETVSHGKDGRVTDRYREGEAQVVQSHYRKDGATITESRKSWPDGRMSSVDVVAKNGIVETTRSNSHRVDRPLSQVAPEHGQLNTEFGDTLTTNPLHGKAEPTEVTHTTRTVQDGDNAPKTVSDSTSYRQFTPIKDAFEGGDGNTSFDLTNSTNFVPYDGSFEFNRHGRSGQVDAVTVTSVRDGKPVDQVEVGSRETVAWKYQGRDVSTVKERQSRFENGKNVGDVNSIEMRGYQDLTGLQSGGDADDNRKFTDLVDPAQGYSGPQGMRFTQTAVDGKTTWTSQFGDIDNFNKPDSRTITQQYTSQGDDKDTTQWTARKVDAPADGQPGYRVRTQTNTEGSKGYVLDDTTVRPSGESQGKTQVFDGKSDDPVIEQQRSRERVSAADVANQAPLGDAGSNAAFLKANADRPLFETHVVQINHTGKGQGYSLSNTYTAQGSQDQLGYLVSSQSDKPKASDLGYTTVLEQPGSGNPQRVTAPDGTVLSTDRAGRLTARNAAGQIADLGQPDGLDPLSLTGSGAGSFKDIYHSLSEARLPPGFIGGTGLVNAFSGLSGLGGSTSDNLGAGSSLTSGVADLSEAASSLAAKGGSLETVLSGGSEILGTAGGVLGIGAGIAQIAKGDTVQGGFSVAAGAGATAAGAAGLGLLGEGAVAAAVPGIGWGIAGVAVAGSLIYTLLQDDPDPYQSASLKI